MTKDPPDQGTTVWQEAFTRVLAAAADRHAEPRDPRANRALDAMEQRMRGAHRQARLGAAVTEFFDVVDEALASIQQHQMRSSWIAQARRSPGRLRVARRRESHSTHPGHKRQASSSRTASSDPGDSDPPAAPSGRREVAV